MISLMLWGKTFRVISFWLIVAGVIVLANLAIDSFSLATLWEVGERLWIGPATETAPDAARPETFAALAASLVEDPIVVSSLAWAIASTGAGLLVAFFILHVVIAKVSIGRARKFLNRTGGELAFASNYEEIKRRLLRHPLIGAAWKEFDDTLLTDKVASGGPIENTVRPQVLINMGVLRDRLPGLKFIGSISGYFVGVGLLLTFIGIVLALSKASEATGDNPEAMQGAVGDLLKVASFKFATSIAGLATSIAFALCARWFVIGIESSLARFCEDAEHQLKYSSPNSIAAKSYEVGREQRDHLAEINNDRYFSRLADSVAPLIEQAMTRAMAPVSERIGSAVDQLKSTSQAGLADMTKDFAAALHSGAGTEMRGLQESLREIQLSLTKTHESMTGGGEDFSRRLSEAAASTWQKKGRWFANS
jgi:hypothetical protein